MIEIKEPFKVRLDKALEYREMKPADLAKASGLSESTISQYRSGYSKPKEDRLVLIANVLRVDPSWLMGLDVPMLRSAAETNNVQSETSADSIDLEIMERYKNLSDEQKKFILQIMDNLGG